MTLRKPKKVHRRYRDMITDVDGVRLCNAIRALQVAQTDALKEGWTDLSIGIEVYGADCDGSAGVRVDICGRRMETEEEFRRRVEAMDRSKRSKMERDRVAWDRLREEYGEDGP